MKKKVYLDLLRIIACFFVIVNHTNSSIIFSTGPSITWFLSLEYCFACKIAVPIFLMISGALLLVKEDDYKKSIKRIIRIVLVIAIFSLIYYINNCCISSKTFSILEYLKLIYQSTITPSYWYLYAYLGIMFMLPILQPLVKNLSDKKIIYFLCISFIFLGGMPILEHYLPGIKLNSTVGLYIFNTIIGYLIAGYYIDNKVKLTRKKAYMALFTSLVFIILPIVLTYFEYQKNPSSYLFLAEYNNLFVILSSCSIFYLIKYCYQKKFVVKFSKIICYVGSLTFGIYLVSDILIQKIRPFYIFLCEHGIYKLLSMIIFEIVVFCVGAIITAILKLIPGIKKLI